MSVKKIILCCQVKFDDGAPTVTEVCERLAVSKRRLHKSREKLPGEEEPNANICETLICKKSFLALVSNATGKPSLFSIYILQLYSSK